MASLAMPHAGAGAPQKAEASLRIIATAGFVILLAHLWVALTRGINWDEFHYFDLIRRHAAGTLDASLQTFHVHLFGWLPDLPFDPIAQIQVGRLAMLGCLGGAAMALYGLAAKFVSRQAAALTSLVWLTGGFVLTHGTAFRGDPPATMLMLTALWLLASRALTPRYAIAAGIVAGLASAITIKTSLYAPAFAAIAWLRWNEADHGKVVRQFLMAGFSAIAAFSLLYLWHRSQLIAAPPTAGAEASKSAWETVFSEGFLPRLDALWDQIKSAPHVAFLIGLAPCAWAYARIGWAKALVMLGLILPLATVLFYRNAYPYFFVFILAPAIVATAPAIELIARKIHPVLLAVALALFGMNAVAELPRDTLAGQRQTIAEVDRLFPQPVTYIDFAGSLGSHRRAVPFMLSGWGLKDYRAQGEPRLSAIMEREPVPLLITNHPVLGAAILGDRPEERLLDTDADALRDNYISHWDRVYVAGKVFAAGNEPIDARFLVPGTYTLEGSALAIDGVGYRTGDFVTLSRGVHRIGGGRAAPATLRWGRNLPKPAANPPPFPAFEGF